MVQATCGPFQASMIAPFASATRTWATSLRALPVPGVNQLTCQSLGPLRKTSGLAFGYWRSAALTLGLRAAIACTWAPARRWPTGVAPSDSTRVTSLGLVGAVGSVA